MSDETAWSAVVVKKSRALLDGSNLYRRVTIRHDGGHEEKIRVSRAIWKQVKAGDRMVKETGQDPRPV
ncbi:MULTISPECIES: DUF7489 domain-containing protein [Pseudofrankia]|uniref:DUF7489 domain-containing protein n=1 Tax=Pseudofrankia TaxID=2994363 RepID=UPI000234CA26|nr:MULTISPECIES: hypothetical protein [Pseudofrankia]OHV33404.1 hypothetical protein BCD49_27480 [Pseudofrankia sp. EUN1h]